MSGVSQVLFTSEVPTLYAEQYETLWVAKTQSKVMDAPPNIRKGLESLIRSAGQVPDYSFLEDSGRLVRVVLFGEAFTDKRLETWLRKMQAKEWRDAFELRLVATSITDQSLRQLKTTFPNVAFEIVSVESWMANPNLSNATYTST
jgi:hypothetical protein